MRVIPDGFTGLKDIDLLETFHEDHHMRYARIKKCVVKAVLVHFHNAIHLKNTRFHELDSDAFLGSNLGLDQP